MTAQPMGPGLRLRPSGRQQHEVAQPDGPVIRCALAHGVRYRGPRLLLHLRWVRLDEGRDGRSYLLDERREALRGLPLEVDLGLLDLHVGEPTSLEQPAERVRRGTRERPGRAR